MNYEPTVQMEPIAHIPLSRITALLDILLAEDYRDRWKTEPEVSYFLRVVETVQKNHRANTRDITRGY